MEKEKYDYREERVDFIIGVVTLLAVIALFALLLAGIRRSGKTLSYTGEISTLGETRRGSEQIFTYNLDDQDIADGEKVIWTVNGVVVLEDTYTKGEPITLTYNPYCTGDMDVTARVGHYRQNYTVNVLPPRLTLKAPNVTITYGDDLPEMRCEASGFVETDDVGDFCYDGCCIAEADKLNVGVYQVKFDKECSYSDYEMDYVYGTLAVLPRRLEIGDKFTKVYDGYNTIDHPTITLDGVIEGDEVQVKCDTLYFDNKNVGNDKTVILANVELVGDDACNYTLPDFACGQIAPKSVTIDGLTVKNKLYDGTTKATIDTMGTINGVCEGDSVAIGGIDVSFEQADVGEQNIVAKQITLIGADKDNYTVGRVDAGTAHIDSTSTLWDKLFTKEPTVRAN